MRLARTLLTALAALAVGAPAASAAVPGVNLGTSEVPGGLIQTPDVDRAAAAGAKSIRIFVDWHQVEPSDGGYEVNRVTTLSRVVRYAHARGITPVLVVFSTPGWANGGQATNVPPADNEKYAEFVGYLAGQLKGAAPVFEVWNEQDEPHFWAGAPQPVKYADMLKRTKAAVDAADPEATVLFGALTGNNYTFFEQVFDQGGLTPDSFDGVAVHTDTACLVNGPDFYVRNMGQDLDGRINRFSFLGFREVRASMVARGADKPIWMTELGWSSYTGACEVPGVEADRKGGVSAEQQAAFTRRAYECLANYPYVTQALVFDLRDRGADRTGLYGLLTQGNAPKPAYSAFTGVAAAPPAAGIECGDFTPPAVTELMPAKTFTGALRLRAKATDPSDVTRMTMKADGKLIRNWTGTAVGSGKVVDYEWQHAKDLAPGEHTIRIEAIDKPSNVGAVEVKVLKVDPSQMAADQPTALKITKVKVRRGKATLTAYVSKAGSLAMRGKVEIQWQSKRPVKVKGKRKLVWKKIHGGLRGASITSTGTKRRIVFTQPLKYARYRVRVKLLTEAPYKASASAWRNVRRR